MITAGPWATLPRPLLVVGAYGYRNVGDEAILAGLLRALGPGTGLSVVSRAPAETAALHVIPTIPISRAAAGLRGSRSVLIGGGGLFGPDLGLIGRLLGPFGLAAALGGKQVAVAGVGVDDHLSSATAWGLRRLAAAGTWFGVRDGRSAAALHACGIDATVMEDLSVGLPPGSRTEAAALLRAKGLDPTRPIIGLCLHGLDARLARQLPATMSEVVEGLPGVQFCFVPMSQHPYVVAHNDLLLGLAIRAAAPRVAILDGLYHPAIVLAAFRLFSAAVCMRYHSLLFAARAGIPIVALPAADKCRDWLTERGSGFTEPSGPAVLAALRDALDERSAWSA
ncbi:MAG: polysaccharide pyruvyl transferase family protein [Candidatus Limnocylindrales bacterium]